MVEHELHQISEGRREKSIGLILAVQVPEGVVLVGRQELVEHIIRSRCLEGWATRIHDKEDDAKGE